MLREFLQDFEEKLDVKDDAPLSYPTAVPNAPLSRGGKPGKPASARSAGKQPASRKASKPASRKAAPPPPAEAAPLGFGADLEPSVDDLTEPDNKQVVLDENMLKQVDAAPRLNPAHWDGARPASAPQRGSRLESASLASLSRGHASPSYARAEMHQPNGPWHPPARRARARVTPRAAPDLGRYIGVIHSASAMSLPRKKKSDPVSMHARRESQWRSDSFLANSPARKPAKERAPPAPPVTAAAPRRRVNTYVVPTSKRRDDVVWATRQRMRENTNVPSPRMAGRKQMIPNMCAPPPTRPPPPPPPLVPVETRRRHLAAMTGTSRPLRSGATGCAGRSGLRWPGSASPDAPAGERVEGRSAAMGGGGRRLSFGVAVGGGTSAGQGRGVRPNAAVPRGGECARVRGREAVTAVSSRVRAEVVSVWARRQSGGRGQRQSAAHRQLARRRNAGEARVRHVGDRTAGDAEEGKTQPRARDAAVFFGSSCLFLLKDAAHPRGDRGKRKAGVAGKQLCTGITWHVDVRTWVRVRLIKRVVKRRRRRGEGGGRLRFQPTTPTFILQ